MTGSEIEALPVTEQKPVLEMFICGVDSSVADRHRETGTEELLFYYDLEQVEAGLDKVYGMMSLDALAEDWTSPDGTVHHAGALVMVVSALTRLESGGMLFAVLVSS